MPGHSFSMNRIISTPRSRPQPRTNTINNQSRFVAPDPRRGRLGAIDMLDRIRFAPSGCSSCGGR